MLWNKIFMQNSPPDGVAKCSEEAPPGIVAGSGAAVVEAAAVRIAEPATAARGAKPISVPCVRDALPFLFSVMMLNGAAFG